MNDKCQICTIESKLTKHHLIPRVKCHNKYKKIENNESNFIMICDECHRTIHAYFSENELRDKFNTIERLMSNEKFAAYEIFFDIVGVTIVGDDTVLEYIPKAFIPLYV